MTTAAHPHEVLLQEIRKEYADVFTQKIQGVYIYMDDPHWICNDKFATLLGYASENELMKLSSGSTFLDSIVTTDSQRSVVDSYMSVVNQTVANSIIVAWKKKDGSAIRLQTIFAPISFQGNLLAIHFVTPT